MSTSTTLFSTSNFDVTTKTDASSNTTTKVALTEQFGADDKLFSRVYVNRFGIVTGGRFAEDAGLPPDPEFTGHMGMRVPAGTTDQRPTKGTAVIRYNTDLNAFEVFEAGSWTQPFEATNFSAVTENILPAVQSSEVFQIDVGNAVQPFRSGQFGRIVITQKATLSSTDSAAGTLANYNNTLYWGGQPIATANRKTVISYNINNDTTIPTTWLNRYIRILATSINNVIVPNGLGSIGDTIELIQAGTSSFTLVADSNIAINSAYATFKPRAQYSKIELTCVASNVWDLSGDLASE